MTSAEKLANDLKDYIVPIYRDSEGGTPTLMGSGFLLRVDDVVYLCTAAHVLDERGEANLYLPADTTLQVFGGRFSVTKLPPSGRDDDRYDFAFCELDKGALSRFSKYRVIDAATIGDRKGHYLFVGYPATRNRSERRTHIVAPEVVAYAGRAYDKAVKDFNADTHLLVRFNMKEMTDRDGHKVKPIAPYGISGSCVWSVDDIDQSEAEQARLVGVAMRCRHDALVALRIGILVEAIRMQKKGDQGSVAPVPAG
jgi:hypothetical protein